MLVFGQDGKLAFYRMSLPRELVGFLLFDGARHLGDFDDHLHHARCVLDHAIEVWDDHKNGDAPATTASAKGFLEVAGRFVKVGLLQPALDERTGRWTLDADGPLMRQLKRAWIIHGSDPCPFDAELVIMLLYLCVLTDAPTFRRLVDAHPNAIMGGQLDRLCMPRELNPHDSIGPAIGNSLDACAALATDNMRIRVYIDYILEKEV